MGITTDIQGTGDWVIISTRLEKCRSAKRAEEYFKISNESTSPDPGPLQKEKGVGRLKMNVYVGHLDGVIVAMKVSWPFYSTEKCRSMKVAHPVTRES